MPLRPVRACALPFGGHRRVGGMFASFLGDPSNYMQEYDNVSHLGSIRCFVETGNWSPFSTSLYAGAADAAINRFPARFLPDGLVQRRCLHGEPARRPHSAFGKRRKLRVRGAGAAHRGHRLLPVRRHRLPGIELELQRRHARVQRAQSTKLSSRMPTASPSSLWPAHGKCRNCPTLSAIWWGVSSG